MSDFQNLMATAASVAADLAADNSSSAAPAEKILRIAIDADVAVSYASHQNAVPALHSITVANGTDETLRDVEVVVETEPAFADTRRFRYERLEPGETRVIRPVDLKLSLTYLSGLDEAERGAIKVEVRAGGEVKASESAEISVLAFDQWGGTRTVPELLCAFCTPNHPHIDRLMAEAAGILSAASSGELMMNGYESKNRDAVWSQASAIYAAIARRALQYSLPPASFASSGQKLRMPDRIFEGGVATCLDLTMLLASALEQARLNPVLLLKEGHAWIGCWLINTSFPTSLVDDALAVRKRIDTGEMIAIETTYLTQPGATLRAAMEAGLRHFTEEPEAFQLAIDVQRARLERILPIKSRGGQELGGRDYVEAPADLEAPPVLPPLSGETPLLDDEPAVETPMDRINRWRSKLLDLTLRNRLLNFKPSKVMIPLKVPDLGGLEDALAEGKEWKFRALPPIMEGRDPRSREIARGRTGEDPVEVMAREAMGNHELLARLEESKLNSALNEVYLTVKTGLEETGANTLYLVLGFLRWAEDERAEKTYLAPLLMVPVTLKRASVRAGFSLVRHDDETIVNPTLLQALEERHGVKVRGMDPPPMDDRGVDVPKVLATFRQAVTDIPRWEVVPDVYLGVFSFHKHVMFSDLTKRQDALRQSRIVRHLMDRSKEALGDSDLRQRDDLDDAYAPGAFMTPMLADASQLNALRRASEGHDYAMNGPPGSGKSQTITNLICDALYQGKRVLFVSEKMAALSVVERRLRSVGLGPFCLQLHSAKAAKAEVLAQLKTSLDVLQQLAPAAWDQEIERLARLRNELNGLVRALHVPHPNGMSVYEAIGMAIGRASWKPAPMAEAAGRPQDARSLDTMRDLAKKMQAVAVLVGTLADNPLKSIATLEWSNAWEGRIIEAAAELRTAVSKAREAVAVLQAPLSLSLELASMRDLASLETLCGLLMQAPTIPASFAQKADDAAARRRLAKLRQHGEARNAIWSVMAASVKPEVARLGGVELQDQWRTASAKWAIPRWFAQRGLRARFIPYTLTGKPPLSEAMPGLIEELVRLNAEDEALKECRATGAELIDEAFEPLQTDWTAVARYEAWGAALEAVLNRFASLDDPSVRQNLADRVHAMVGPHRHLLATTGPIFGRLQTYRDTYRKLLDALKRASDAAGNPHLAGPTEDAPAALTTLEAAAGAWQDRRIHLRDWCRWNEYRAAASPLGLSEVFASIEGGIVPPADIAEYAEYCYRVAWLKDVMDRDDVLRKFSGAVHEQKIRDFKEADERFQGLTQKIVFAKLAGGIAATKGKDGSKGEIATLSREIQKQRMHYPIRKLVKSIPNLLMSLKPCLLMSPLSVAQYLDTDYPPFDLVIFDEASQIPVWDAVGVIARGKQVVVVGDPKQLPPTAFFDRAEGEDAIDEDESAPPKDQESILDECLSIGMSQLTLDWHYRSAHESLIAFSNIRYYDSRLITFPSPATRDTAVKLVQVNGTYDRGGSCINRAEADAIVKRIVEHFAQADAEARKLTMGVVTFNARQMRLIDELLRAELAKKPMIEERMAEHGDERLFIKNLENVQGDERSIILFSTTFGKDAAGRMSLNFGPINQEGGHRRLNVAGTRARNQIEVYSSMRPEDIDLSKTRAAGVADLKAYLDYALRGPAALAMEAAPTNRDPDSPFEREVMAAIRAAGWEVHPQVGCSSYGIDIGVVDKAAPGRYLLGVECDGASYHGFASARDRDRLRQTVLEGLGWTVERVWSTDWWLNRGRCIDTLVARIGALQDEADSRRPVETPA